MMDGVEGGQGCCICKDYLEVVITVITKKGKDLVIAPASGAVGQKAGKGLRHDGNQCVCEALLPAQLYAVF